MTARKNPASEPGRTAIRTKPVRVTVDLDPATDTELNRWVAGAAMAVNPDFPRLPLVKAIRAMIHATTASEAVARAVIEQLRQGQDLAGHDAGRRREPHVRVPRADGLAAAGRPRSHRPARARRPRGPARAGVDGQPYRRPGHRPVLRPAGRCPPGRARRVGRGARH